MTIFRGVAVLMLACFAPLAAAHGRPARPIRLMVPFPPGGALDGCTLLAGNIQTLALDAAVYPQMPYDARKDFAAIVQTVKVKYVLVVNPEVPAAR